MTVGPKIASKKPEATSTGQDRLRMLTGAILLLAAAVLVLASVVASLGHSGGESALGIGAFMVGVWGLLLFIRGATIGDEPLLK